MNTLGSYAFGSFSANERELERLQRQASIAWPLEQAALRAAGVEPGLRVVDLACGPGVVTHRIATEVGPAGEVLGVELNPDLLAVARAQPVPDGSTARFVAGDVYDLGNLPETSFDIAYARFLVQHLERPLDALAAVKRILKPGGRLIIADSDDALFDLDPRPDRLDDFLALAAAGQSALGGDRTIGRKLAGLLHRAGYVNVRPSVVVVTTDGIPARDFLDITTAFKLELLPDSEQDWARAMLAGSYRAAEAGALYGSVGVYFTTGEKPRAT